MQAQRINPRDGRWEREQRTYRVYFTEERIQNTPAQVLEWVAANSRERAFNLYAVDADDHDVGLLHLMSRPGEPAVSAVDP